MAFNARAKGRRIARKGVEYLESLGFLVDDCERSNRRGKGPKDLYGLFDAIAVKGKRTVFVQFAAASNRKPDRHFLDWSSGGPDACQMLWYDRRGFVVFWYVDGVRERKDERK